MKFPTNLLLRFHRDQRGQAIFIGVFYFLLLAALIFFVFNSGDKANNKIAMQDAADSAAVTGAGWYARGLNTVAMCNVAQTQFLSVIVLLDSMQTAAPLAQQAIDDYISKIPQSPLKQDGAGGNRPTQFTTNLQQWLIVGNAAQEQQMIRTLNQMIKQVPMDEYCTYDSGVLWQCCYVLNDLADQMAALTPEMCQREATKVATADQADVGFFLPFTPQLPLTIPSVPVGNSKSAFENFRKPMTIAQTPTGDSIPGYGHLQGYSSRRGGSKLMPSGTLGPFNYMRQPFVEPEPMGLFELSDFSTLYAAISDSKLDILFGGPDANVPQLISNYDDYLAYFNAYLKDPVGNPPPLATYWTQAGFFSRYEFPNPSFYDNSTLRYPPYPREPVNFAAGFVLAPAGWTRSSMPDGSDGADAWENTFYLSREITWPPSTPWNRNPPRFFPYLGIYLQHAPPYTAADEQIYYSTNVWRFCGALIPGQTSMRSKYLPPAGVQVRLAPLLMQPGVIAQNDSKVFNWFSFVGFAYKNGNSQIWPKYFPNPVPTNDKLICYGQTVVYNPSCNSRPPTWNSFTQDWRTRLVRLDHWNWSMAQIADAPSGPAANYVTADSTAPVLKMLQMYDAGSAGSSTPDDPGSFVQLITH